MSRFTDGLKIIPAGARVTAVCVYVAWVVGFALAFLFTRDQGMQSMPAGGKFAVMFIAPLLAAIYILLIGFVNGDSKRRGMRHVMWTLLAIFIPNGIGIILYFILRDPPMKPCPRCGHIVKAGFTFCPHCGNSLQPTCPGCGKGVEADWSNCPRCGTKLPNVGPATAPGAIGQSSPL